MPSSSAALDRNSGAEAEPADADHDAGHHQRQTSRHFARVHPQLALVQQVAARYIRLPLQVDGRRVPG